MESEFPPVPPDVAALRVVTHTRLHDPQTAKNPYGKSKIRDLKEALRIIDKNVSEVHSDTPQHWTKSIVPIIRMSIELRAPRSILEEMNEDERTPFLFSLLKSASHNYCDNWAAIMLTEAAENPMATLAQLSPGT